jgi:hypothetical protein
MPHDKIRAAARTRMTATGETYTAARRQAINEHHAAQTTSPVSAEDILAAAAVHRELGPDYSDAVVTSFIEKVDRAVAARVEARLADLARSRPAQPARRRQRPRTRRVARDVLAASAGALVAVSVVGLHEITSPHPGPPVTRLANGACASTAKTSKTSGPCFVPSPRIEVRTMWVTSDGKLMVVAPHR